jgi:foldase protein PrsA
MLTLLLPLALAGCELLNADAASAPQPSAPDEAAAPLTVAIVTGRPVSWNVLRPMLIEASGGMILSEYILDSQIVAELQSRRLAVSERDVEREKSILLNQLSSDPDQAVRLLEELRDRRGLGPRRFELFLRRYASLRKLVADEVQVTDAMLRQAHEERYAPQSVCRLIVVETLAEAGAVRQRLDAGESFTDLAIELSRDRSRNQGGLLPPISPHDPTFPTAISAAASRLTLHEVSDPIALDNGFAILRCENKITPEPVALEQVADELRQEVRLNVERNLMARKARSLLDSADVAVLHAELNEEFKRTMRQAAEPQ